MRRDLQRRMVNVHRDDKPSCAAGGEQVGEEKRRAAVARAGFKHPLDAVLGDDLLVVPHVERELERANAAVAQALPDPGVVVPLEILLSNHFLRPTIRISRGSRSLNCAGAWWMSTRPASVITCARLRGV